MPIDSTDVSFESFQIEGKDSGYFVDPKSDVKQTYIPSPPAFVDVKINPRPGVILVAPEPVTPDSTVLDGLKAVAKEKKWFVACPAADDDDSLLAVFDRLQADAKKLNVVADDIRVAYLPASADAARAFIKNAAEKFGETFVDAGELTL
jgi:hypothetical protein